MRSIPRQLLLVLLLAIPGAGRDAQAGPYTITRYAFGGPQTTSAAVGYALTGGAGQPLVRSSSGGAYVIQSGFWALPGTGTTDVPAPDAPTFTGLLRSAPNPFSSRAEISFQLAAARRVSVEVFDLRGARVRTLLDGTMDAGRYRLPWDGHSDDGAALPAGIYWVQFQSGSTRDRARLVRLP